MQGWMVMVVPQKVTPLPMGAFSLHADAGAGGKDAKALFTSCKAVRIVRPALVSG
jgi:hypothetical protein